MKLKQWWRVALLVTGAGAAVACVDGGEAATGAGGGTPGAGGSNHVDDPGCEGPLGAPKDPDSLPACCPDYGNAHCLDDIPPELEAAAAPCDGGGYCVPDVFIETGGVHTPRACASIGGPGVCLSACIPAVAENAALLPQDVCADDERCAPCISPIDDTDTGACDLGFSCEGTGEGGAPPTSSCDDPATCEYDLDTTCAGVPATDPSAFPACPATVCGSGGHCVPTAAIPGEDAASLADCDASSKCVPDSFISTGGKLTPATCASVGGFEGRCLSQCLPDVASQAELLPQDTCLDSERCVPCFDPFDGTETGACAFSCDTGPAGPAESFVKCCADKGGGTCLPVELVGSESAAQLDATECVEGLGQEGAVCVPDVIFQAHADGGLFQPTACETGFLVQLLGASAEGACLPTCIPEVDAAFGPGQEDCPNGYKCLPCIDQNDETTGACDPQ